MNFPSIEFNKFSKFKPLKVKSFDNDEKGSNRIVNNIDFVNMVSNNLFINEIFNKFLFLVLLNFTGS